MDKYQNLKSTLKTMHQLDDVLVESILDKILLQTMKEYQRKVCVGIEDSVADLLDNFKSKVTLAVFNAAAKWKIADTKLLLFPRNCRFCYNRGKTTIVVIEQDPQIRSLSLHRSITGLEFKAGDSATSRYLLALPYVVFLLRFIDDVFLGLYVAWRNKPLANLEDMLYHPFLPNIHESLNVCMPKSPVCGNNICQLSEAAITMFWNSSFNNDLSSYWWRKKHIKNLSDIRSWVNASKENPLFILESEFIGSRTLRDQIDFLAGQNESVDESLMRIRLEQEVDECIQGLFEKILTYFKKNKYEKHFPKEIKENVLQIVQQITKSLIDIVQSLEIEANRQLESPSVTITPRSAMWSDYEQ